MACFDFPSDYSASTHRMKGRFIAGRLSRFTRRPPPVRLPACLTVRTDIEAKGAPPAIGTYHFGTWSFKGRGEAEALFLPLYQSAIATQTRLASMPWAKH
jgi:hypothetical protein